MVAATFMLAAAAASPSETADPVVSRGLTHTAQDRQVLEKAIGRTNLLLSQAGRTLAASWQLVPAAGGKAAIPVYLVAAPTGAAALPAAVPRGCVCIFINPAALAAWLKPHVEGKGRFELDASHLLAFMLLHEVGHIAEGSASGEFVNGTLSQLNIEPSRAKASEEKADEFASDLIRKHAKPGTNAFLDANFIAMELSKLSWNMQAYRSLDMFGSTALGTPSVFFDQGYSHPNLEWRILRSNYLIQQTTEAQQLLDAFEKARRRGSTQRPIYKKQ
jgi:hypothetical protein